jgi:hypothetical protein
MFHVENIAYLASRIKGNCSKQLAQPLATAVHDLVQ